MLYGFARGMLFIFMNILFRIKITGSENIPEGGAIVCSNHISNFDPITLGITIRRHIYFMAKKELFKTKFSAWILTNIKAFPVDRNARDMTSFKKAVAFLKEGKLMGIFAQGTRVKEMDSKSAKAGAALFAQMASVPIVPVGIQTNYKLFSKIYVTIGKPVYINQGEKLKGEALSEFMENLMTEIAKLAEVRK